MSIEVIIVVDGTNALSGGRAERISNMILIIYGTTIANKDCTSKFLIKLLPHLFLKEGYDIEISDISNVITIKLLLFVNRGGSSLSLNESEELFLLEVALDVTLSASSIRSKISNGGLNLCERRVVGSSKNRLNPLATTIELLNLITNNLSIREEKVNIGDTILVSMIKDRVLERHTRTMCISEDLFKLSMS